MYVDFEIKQYSNHFVRPGGLNCVIPVAGIFLCLKAPLIISVIIFR